MSEHTKIAWTDHTFNPWWGCTQVSPGCTNCYAKGNAAFRGYPGIWGAEAPRRFFGDGHWTEPLKWEAKAMAAGVRRRVFCGSMCDVFEDREEYDSVRQRLFEMIDATPNLDWLLLTKRPENMPAMAPQSWAGGWPMNVWAMATIESQQVLAERMEALLRIPAFVRGVSAEPLLGHLDFGLRNWITRGRPSVNVRESCRIDWVIVGCETGSRRRPCSLRDVQLIVEDCEIAGVACFVKQLSLAGRIEKDPEKWPAHLRVQEIPLPE